MDKKAKHYSVKQILIAILLFVIYGITAVGVSIQLGACTYIYWWEELLPKAINLTWIISGIVLSLSLITSVILLVFYGKKETYVKINIIILSIISSISLILDIAYLICRINYK